MAGKSPAAFEVVAVLSRVLGALLRALLVVVVIATPSLLVPGTTEEAAQVVMLIALALGGFVLAEYGATYPALVEFRDAPPYNRVRILSLFVMLIALSLVARGPVGGGDTSLLIVVQALGLWLGQLLDFGWSPLRVVLSHLPPEAGAVSARQVIAMAGLAFVTMLCGLAVFAVLVRWHHWPSRSHPFNVWINLPTFDPTMGGDVVPRLIRDARVNFFLALVATFILPVAGLKIAGHFDPLILTSPRVMVWGMALWMFLPLSMAMRGLAMVRVAQMIRSRRARLVAEVVADAPQAV